MANEITVKGAWNLYSTAYNKEFWSDFIHLYKSLPALWKVKSEYYRNRHLKNEGYELMVKKLREIDPNANRESVKKKINGLRTNYRRELNKIKDCKKKGIAYEPSLWYFKTIDFLREQEALQDNSLAGSSTDDEQSTEMLSDTISQYAHMEESPSVSHIVNTSRKRKIDIDQKNDLLELAYKQLSSTNTDEAEILGNIWAIEFKKLKPDQQLFAKKAINDILFEGQLGTLTRHSVKINDNSSSWYSSVGSSSQAKDAVS